MNIKKEKPKIIQHLISIGFKELYGEWKPIWGQGDGEYWEGKLAKGDDVIYTHNGTTHCEFSYNGKSVNKDFLMSIK
jgi:hypothetical protein